MPNKMVVPVLLLVPSIVLHAQATNQTKAKMLDVLVATTGEKFMGKLLSANDTSIVFESDAAGKVTIDWSKVQELVSSSDFAMIAKGKKLRTRQDATTVPQGTVLSVDQQIHVNPANSEASKPEALALTDVANVVDRASFERAFGRHSLWEGWSGGATAGTAYTNSTQESQSYTAALNLTRAVPGESWIDDRTRTLLAFSEAYGEISQPGTATSKTSITHFGLEQDWYLTPRLFGFVQALLDHNYSLGLHLQQDDGGGFGFVVTKTARQEFDVKASADYIHQQFTISSHNQSLVGSTFGERYTYGFAHGVLFTENGDYIPAWNNPSAYLAVVSANLTLAVYRHLGFTLGGIDNYLNNPPAGYKTNSFTLTMGVTYSVR